MNFDLKPLLPEALAQHKTDALMVLVESTSSKQDSLPGIVGELLRCAQKSGDFEAKTGQLLQLWQATGWACGRVILVGLGEVRKDDPVAAGKKVRQAVTAAVQSLKETTATKIAIAFTRTPTPGSLSAAMQAVADAAYVYTLTKPSVKTSALKSVLLGLPETGSLAAWEHEFRQGVAIVQGVAFAKEWANRPANFATPTDLARAAQSLAKSPVVQCEVLDAKQVAKLGMGAFMAVAQGSEQPLKFIVLRYQGAAKSEAPVVLVGKGITFDSGGISIKPSEGMDEMKFDMGGAASVLGVFSALGTFEAKHRPQINVIGLIPACENLPDGRAVKPGDVVTSMSGQTIEILNTDAEGRLVLCDALTYAERFKPSAVIDIATLTGACVVALGAVRSGLFTTNDALANDLQTAGESALDLCWRMPLDDEYAEGLKTNFADVANVAGRPAGSITAAKFLQRFSKKFNWAHLDIAGTAWKSGAAKGATGRPVPLLLSFLLQQASGALTLKATGKVQRQPKAPRKISTT